MTEHDPHAVLAREHRLTERALNVLGGICDEARRTGTLNAAEVTQVIQFLREMGERTFERFAAMVEALEAKHGGSGLLAKDGGRTT